MTNFHHTEKKLVVSLPQNEWTHMAPKQGYLYIRLKDDKLSNLVTKPLCPYISGL